MYAVQLGADIYALHAFQKKSKTGIKTPKQDCRSGEGAANAGEEDAEVTEEKLDITKGSGNVFRDAGLPDPDAELLKAQLATAIIRAQRERKLTSAAAEMRRRQRMGHLHCKLDRFTIDRLARIARSLDPQVRLVFARAPQARTARG